MESAPSSLSGVTGARRTIHALGSLTLLVLALVVPALPGGSAAARAAEATGPALEVQLTSITPGAIPR
jgi:hypothetical protein